MERMRNPDAITTFKKELENNYKGIACDGQFFYLTMPNEKKIHKYDQHFNLMEQYNVRRCYSAICYDNAENCFWASDDRHHGLLFKLNTSLKETESVPIRCDKRFSEITGLTWDCKTGSLFVSFSDFIVECSMDGHMIRMLQETDEGPLLGVLSICPYYAVVLEHDHIQMIDVYSTDGQFMGSYNTPDACKIKDLVFHAGADPEQNKIHFVVLAASHNAGSRLLQCMIESSDVILHPCNYDSFCQSCDCRCKCDCKPKCKCKECEEEICVNDLIESIAKMETALSHILNAEGEKLQKAVAIADDICDLLEVNKAVNKTITSITFLEQILYAKLEAALDKRKDCKP